MDKLINSMMKNNKTVKDNLISLIAKIVKKLQQEKQNYRKC